MLSKLPKIVDKKSKRLGRGGGSGKGNKSSRGTKRHQKAREKIPIHFEGGQGKITKKYPLLRGKSRNKSIRKTINLTLDDLNIFKANQTIDFEALVKAGFLEMKDKGANLKVLASGKINKKIKLEINASKSAVSAIKKAGGTYKGV
jgi:large subunit ribosomal protein L15